MIKTWLIPIVVLTIMMISLLTINLIVLNWTTFLESFLRQKAKAVLADSLVNDILDSIENIANISVCSSKGNFSELNKMLIDKMKRLWEAILYDEKYFKEYGISIRFDYSIKTREEEHSVEITSRIYVRDLDGSFVLERIHDTVRQLASGVDNCSTGL